VSRRLEVRRDETLSLLAAVGLILSATLRIILKNRGATESRPAGNEPV
jgi:hypothetical protein